MSHDHSTHDKCAYFDVDGRLVKWTYADGCVRVTEKAIPVELRACVNLAQFNDWRSPFYCVEPPKDGDVFYTPFVTEAAR